MNGERTDQPGHSAGHPTGHREPATEHVVWPPERFYWALVEGAPWRGSGPVPAGLLALAEDDLPLPADDLHAVGVLTEAGVLVCAAARSDLAALHDSVLTLRPSSTPPGSAAESTALNLLVGEFEPKPIGRARLRRHALGAGTLLLCGLLLSVGLARRSGYWTRQAAADEQAWTMLATSEAPGASESTILLDLQHIAGRLGGAAGLQPPADAALMLASLLEHWPAQVACKPQSIVIRSRTVTVSVLVADAPEFLAAIAPPTGWTMDQPMLNSAGEFTRLSLTFHADVDKEGS